MPSFKVGPRARVCDTAPKKCPQCHHSIVPLFLVGVERRYEAMGSAVVELVFQCPHHECLRAFIGRYLGEYDRGINDHRYVLRSTTPFSPPPPEVPAEVAEISPQFVKVHQQAAAAEAWGLEEVAGVGYRKALEFLVKDYCIKSSPTDEEIIKKSFLGKVINDHLSDENIKQCARRAAWLGNDETHYVRLWTERDIADLKALLALTVSWMKAHLLTQKYLNAMPQ